MAVENIDTSSFSVGTVQASVYAKVDGAEVLPRPTNISAFEVISAAASGPLYTTLENVTKEVPGKWPESITDEMVIRAIEKRPDTENIDLKITGNNLKIQAT